MHDDLYDFQTMLGDMQKDAQRNALERAMSAEGHKHEDEKAARLERER